MFFHFKPVFLELFSLAFSPFQLKVIDYRNSVKRLKKRISSERKLDSLCQQKVTPENKRLALNYDLCCAKEIFAAAFPAER